MMWSSRIYNRINGHSLLRMSLPATTLYQLRFISEHSWAADRLKKQGEMLEPDESWKKKPTIKICTPDDLVNSSDDKIRSLADQVLNLNIIELSQLAFLVQRRTGMPEHLLFGDLTPPHLRSASQAATATQVNAAAVKPIEEEVKKAPEPAKKLMFTVKLVSYTDANKVKVIKEVRGVSGLGLKEAKDLVESCPKVIKTGVGKEEADAIKEKITTAGGVVEFE